MMRGKDARFDDLHTQTMRITKTTDAPDNGIEREEKRGRGEEWKRREARGDV